MTITKRIVANRRVGRTPLAFVSHQDTLRHSRALFTARALLVLHDKNDAREVLGSRLARNVSATRVSATARSVREPL
jgi:hypothetical protein